MNDGYHLNPVREVAAANENYYMKAVTKKILIQ